MAIAGVSRAVMHAVIATLCLAPSQGSLDGMADKDSSCPAGSATGNLEWGNSGTGRLLNELWQRAGLFTVRVKTDIGEGSGVVYDVVQNTTNKTLSYIIATNHHVTQSASTAKVDVSGQELEASKKYYDPDADITILSLVSTMESPLPLEAVRRCNGSAFPGQSVVAFGFPLGLKLTMAPGYVTGEGRRNTGPKQIPEIQSNVGLLDGHSGGPLVDLSGCLLGMNRAALKKALGTFGVYLSIPAEALDLAAKAMYSGGSRRTSLGVRAEQIPEYRMIVEKMIREGLEARSWLVPGSTVMARRLTPGAHPAPSATLAQVLNISYGAVTVSGAAGTHGEPCNGFYVLVGHHNHRPLYRNTQNASIFFHQGVWHMDDEGTTEVRKAVFVTRSSSELPPSGSWTSRIRGVAGPNVSVAAAHVSVRFSAAEGEAELEQDLPPHLTDRAATVRHATETMSDQVANFFDGPTVSKSYGLAISLETAYVGQLVRRGADWQWKDQDGYEGAEGVITALEPNESAVGVEPGWCEVLWNFSRTRAAYRIGAGGAYDLEPADPEERLAVLWPLDVITHVGRKRVFNQTNVFTELESLTPGSVVNVTFTSLRRWKYLKHLGTGRASQDAQSDDGILALARLFEAQGDADAAVRLATTAAALEAQRKKDTSSSKLDSDPYGEDVQQILKEGLSAASFTMEVKLLELDARAGSADAEVLLSV